MKPEKRFAIGDAVAMANEPNRVGLVMGHRWSEQLEEWIAKVSWFGGPVFPRTQDWLGVELTIHHLYLDGRPASSGHSEESLVKSWED